MCGAAFAVWVRKGSWIALAEVSVWTALTSNGTLNVLSNICCNFQFANDCSWTKFWGSDIRADCCWSLIMASSVSCWIWRSLLEIDCLRFWSKARFHSSTVVDACCWCLSTSCSYFELRRTFCKWLAAVSALGYGLPVTGFSGLFLTGEWGITCWIRLLLSASSPTLASMRMSWRGRLCEESPLQDRGLPGGVPIDTEAGMSSTTKLLRLALRARITTRNHLRRREAGGGNLPRKGITSSGLITWIYRSTTKNRQQVRRSFSS